MSGGARRQSAVPVLALMALVVTSGPARPALAQDGGLVLPPPPLAALLPLAEPALEKPPVPVPRVEHPAAPEAIPELPPPRPVPGPAARPPAPLPAPRALACNPLGSMLGVASELLECGRARLGRGELDEARKDLQGAVQRSTDRQVVREARYWLAETLVRLGQPTAAEPQLSMVAQDDPRGELGLYASHTLGWVLLERGEAARALPAFERVLRGGAPPDLVPAARHGHALALYGLRRYAEARAEWTALLAQSIPADLATEASFWLGETLARLGDPAGAVGRLAVFTAGGLHPLTETALLRLGWWRRAAGQPLEAVKTYRALLSAYPRTAEASWARAGLALALLDVGDYGAAREEARQLVGLDRAGTLGRPVLLALARWLADKGRAAEAEALAQELLGQTLDPATRAWVLLMSAEAHRQAGQLAEARSELELVRGAPGRPILGAHATLRLGQLDLEGRDFAQARAAAEALSGERDAAVRAAALVVAGEAAYGARDYDAAAAHYARFVAEFPAAPEAAAARLALAWTAYRRQRPEEARREWIRFAREAGADPRAPAALALAAELAAKAGDAGQARQLLDQLVARFPADELAPVAVLNRAILAIRAGQPEPALGDLRGLGARAAASPHLGRIRLAQGVALALAGRLPEAEADLRVALGEGEDLAHLGLGWIAFQGRRWSDAARELLAARDAGLAGVAAAAEYGLAAVLWNEGKKEEFRRLAAPLLAGPADPATAPFLLEAMARVDAEDKRWPEARTSALRVAADFPRSEAAPRVLAFVGGAAAREGQWPVAREVYQALADRFPASPALAAAELDFAEALLRTGAVPEARRRLESLAAASPADPRMPRALLLLARAREATGDRPGALEAYARLGRDYPDAPATEATALAQGRLLQADGRWKEAQPLLARALASADPGDVAEAAYQLGEGLRAAGQHQEAVELYMTAAYVAPDSPWAHKALLGAGQSFTALRQRDAAAIVYRKLAAAPGAPPELAEAARKELKALGGG